MSVKDIRTKLLCNRCESPLEIVYHNHVTDVAWIEPCKVCINKAKDEGEKIAYIITKAGV